MSQPTTSPEWAAFRAQIVQKTARASRIATAKKRQPKEETANGLTRKIIRHIRASGGWASRLNSTGLYRADLQKFVASQQVGGIPDILSVVNGRAVFVEVKTINDRLSETQKQTISGLIASGAAVYVCRDFESFVAWFTALLALPDPDDSLPFGPSTSQQ